VVLSEIGGFFLLIGSVGVIYPRIIKRIKMWKKTEAEYYHEKFNNATPAQEKRKATRYVIFGCFAIVGAIMIIIGTMYGY